MIWIGPQPIAVPSYKKNPNADVVKRGWGIGVGSVARIHAGQKIPEEIISGSFVFSNFANIRFETSEDYDVYTTERDKLRAEGHYAADCWGEDFERLKQNEFRTVVEV